jgi:hypothetical protein
MCKYLKLSFYVCMFALSAAVQGAEWDVKFYDPKPANIKDELHLPMPCDGKMVFRKIFVPVANPLDDLRVKLGNGDAEKLQYLEQGHDAHIAGSFSTTEPVPGRFYWMAKYELTELQYQALMQTTCPVPDNKLMIPKVSLSWFEALNFGDRYNQWLRKNALKALPVEDVQLDNAKKPSAFSPGTGFVRLPTETEWEFAARGGENVSPSEFLAPVFPMETSLNDYVVYGGAQSSRGQLSLVGRRKPNPFGLYDILGNADEMTFDSFRLSRLKRLHGQAGGFVARGGNFNTPEDEIRASWREERTYYTEAEPNRQKTGGMRLVLVSPALTSQKRTIEIEQSWAKLGAPNEQDVPSAALVNGSIERLGSLAAEMKNEKLISEVNAVKLEFKANTDELQKQRGVAIRSSLQQGAFMCVRLNNDGRIAEVFRTAYERDCAKPDPANAPQIEACEKRRVALVSREQALDLVMTIYADTIVDSASIYTAQFVEPEVKTKKAQLTAQRSGNLDRYLDTHWSHLKGYFDDQKISRPEWLRSCKAVAN